MGSIVSTDWKGTKDENRFTGEKQRRHGCAGGLL